MEPTPSYSVLAAASGFLTMIAALGGIIAFFSRRERDARSDYTALIKEVSNRNEQAVCKLRDIIDAKVAELHNRISRLQKATLEPGDLKHLEEGYADMRAELREATGEITKLKVNMARDRQ